jgi:hypothetical protein
MKKLIVTAVALTLAATSGYSQGFTSITLGALGSTHTSTNSVIGGPSTGQTATTAGLYYFALFASANQATVNGSTAGVSGISANYVFNNLGTGTPTGGWELVGIGQNSASLGRIVNLSQGTTSAGQGALNSDSSMTVQGILGGANANEVVVGWSASIGTTLAAMESWYSAGAIGGWIGQSAVATGLTLGDGGLNAVVNPFGTGTGQVGGILLGLTPVPEPTTLALAGLGGASLLLFRRRK